MNLDSFEIKILNKKSGDVLDFSNFWQQKEKTGNESPSFI